MWSSSARRGPRTSTPSAATLTRWPKNKSPETLSLWHILLAESSQWRRRLHGVLQGASSLKLNFPQINCFEWWKHPTLRMGKWTRMTKMAAIRRTRRVKISPTLPSQWFVLNMSCSLDGSHAISYSLPYDNHPCEYVLSYFDSLSQVVPHGATIISSKYPHCACTNVALLKQCQV